MEKPFQGFATFLKSPIDDFSRRIGVVGVPFDGATSYRPGARFGPNAIRQSSMMLTDGAHPLFESEPRLHCTDLGDIAVSNVNTAKSLDQITDFLGKHEFFGMPNKLALLMGGDHTITTASLRHFAQRHDDLVVLHFDAHCDTWEDHFGDPLGHGTWVRNVIDEKLVKPENVMQIGIRSPVDPVTKRWLTAQGGHVFGARAALRQGPAAMVRQIRSLVRERPVYISFDIDALDPAYAPGTGTPEIGGLTPIFCLDVLEAISHIDLVGMDLVEVNPSFDPAGITSLAAATLMWTVASMKCWA